jgi:hypothetical protein
LSQFQTIYPTRTAFDEPQTKPVPPEGWEVQRGLIVPIGNPKRRVRLQRVPYKCGKPVAMRIIVDFQVKSKLNTKLWGALKLPSGWRKSPRQQWKNDNHFPVRLYAYEALSLSAEELSNIQAQLALMETI